MKTKFILKDDSVKELYFTNTEEVLSVTEEEWIEIHDQLSNLLRIACTQLTGEEVFDLLDSGKQFRNRFNSLQL